MLRPIRIPIAPAPGDWSAPARFLDICDACGLFLELAPGTDRCLRCDEQARAAARRGACR